MNETTETGQIPKRQLSKKGIWLMRAAFVSAGLMIVFVAFDLIHTDPSDIHAPGWALAVSGMMFVIAGFLIPASRDHSKAKPGLWRQFLGLMLMACFAVVFSWVAFGPGEREFTTSVNGFIVEGSGETFGRTLFGFFAVLVDLWLVWGVYDFLNKLIRKR